MTRFVSPTAWRQPGDCRRSARSEIPPSPELTMRFTCLKSLIVVCVSLIVGGEAQAQLGVIR